MTRCKHFYIIFMTECNNFD